VVEGEVDHAVGVAGGGLQHFEVIEIAAAHLGAEGGDGRSGCLGAREADDLMAVGEEFGDDGGGDVARGAGDEDTHGKTPVGRGMSLGVIKIAPG
jgi:hypothetical protein